MMLMNVFFICSQYAFNKKEKGKVNLLLKNRKDSHISGEKVTKQDVGKLHEQCQITTQHCSEPKQKQEENSQRVIEITVHKGPVKTARTKLNDLHLVYKRK